MLFKAGSSGISFDLTFSKAIVPDLMPKVPEHQIFSFRELWLCVEANLRLLSSFDRLGYLQILVFFESALHNRFR